jgi:hypothetical protein
VIGFIVITDFKSVIHCFSNRMKPGQHSRYSVARLQDGKSVAQILAGAREFSLP